ncbi:telomere-associated protein RIF1-like isoform X2 [Prorops nasuta]
MKTKVVAIDALCQLLIAKEETQPVFNHILEERLPDSMRDTVFIECYKSIIHSVGEVLLILSQLPDQELINRHRLGKMLWKNLNNYIQRTTAPIKRGMYRDIFLVVNELATHVTDRPMLKDLLLNDVVIGLSNIVKEVEFHDDIISEFLTKILIPVVFKDMTKHHLEALKCLLRFYIKPTGTTYQTNTIKFLNSILLQLDLQKMSYANITLIIDFWTIISEIILHYMENHQINEGNAANHNFSTIQFILSIPFIHVNTNSLQQIDNVSKLWKNLYRIFDMRADLIPTVKPNEILENVSDMMLSNLQKNEGCCFLVISCLEALLTTINYNCLLDQKDIPIILKLIVKAVEVSFNYSQYSDTEAVLKILASVLITTFGLNINKTIIFLKASKSALEKMMKSKCQELTREIGRTWETIVSIFKGLNKHLKPDLLQLYKDIILTGLHHSNPIIKEQTMSILDKNKLDIKSKLIFQDLEKEKLKVQKLNVTQDTLSQLKDDKIKHVKIAGSFLNRKIESPIKNKKENEEKKLLPPDPSSQDYVFIPTNVKYDVKRLTEHQIESLKRKRDDIPAMYNDLSQSSSQDTQKLQEWFDKKATILQDQSVDDSRNVQENLIKDISNVKNVEGTTLNCEILAPLSNRSKTAKDDQGSKKSEEIKIKSAQPEVDINNVILEESKRYSLSPDEVPNSMTMDQKEQKSEELQVSITVSKKLNFDSRESSSDEREEPSSSAGNKKSETIKLDNDEEKEDKINLRKKAKANCEMSSKILNEKEENKRCKKRKFDEASDLGLSHRRRRLDSEDSNENDISFTEQEAPSTSADKSDTGKLSKKTKYELNRLQINMEFDTQLPSRRRSKILEEEKEFTGRKSFTPDCKLKLKVVEAKQIEVRKTPKLPEKSTKVDGAGAGKRGRKKRSETVQMVAETQQNIENENSVHKQDNKEKDQKIDQSFISQEKDENKTIQDENKIEQVESQDDEEDIVASSQDLSASSKVDKKFNEKQCFIKIDKIENFNAKQEVEKTEESHLNEAKPTLKQENNPFTENSEMDTVQKGNEEETQNNLKEQPKMSEVKQNENSTIKCLIELSSPKNALKRQKQKSFVPQGRAAHMLGLVTKQALLENDSQTPKEEEASKKSKMKDESESTVSKKDKMYKETDRISSPCGSRQEKIFNNMKSVDYALSPVKTFCNLKNDGEKISPRSEKFEAGGSIQQICLDSENEDNSLLPKEKDELPLLEWSASNPPSLNASPSASILKRQRSVIENEDIATPSKKKRVSFADPPVSKEMGYRFKECPSMINKWTSRSIKKYSPLKLKQTLLKLIHIDPKKIEKDDMQLDSASDVDLQCEGESRLLSKIAEEMELTDEMAIEKDVLASNFDSTDVNNTENMVVNTAIGVTSDIMLHEVQISSNLLESREKQEEEIEGRNIVSVIEDEKMTVIETQDDMFLDIDKATNSESFPQLIEETKNNENTKATNTKLNITNDSVIDAVNTEESRSETLEDTVDVQNITGLNSTANSDEIFCGKLIRCSTQKTESSTGELDTLPITDSLFSSLPSTDDPLHNEADIRPELLDSMNPIYPDLVNCKESISTIVNQLTNPLWVQHLSAYLSSRNLKTIGDIAQLSEREINRMPVKGSSKIEYVKTVLQRVEKKMTKQENINAVEKSPVTTNLTVIVAPSTSDTQPISKALANGLLDEISITIPHNKVSKENELGAQTSSSSTPLNKINELISGEISPTKPTEENKSFNLSNLDMNVSQEIHPTSSSTPPSILQGQAIKMVSTPPSISTSNLNFKTVTSTQTTQPLSSSFTQISQDATSTTSKDNENVSKTNETVSVGTDPIPYNAVTNVKTESKSVESQMALEDLLDEIDVNLVLQSAVRRCSAESLITEYKRKMPHVSDAALERDTISYIGTGNREIHFNDKSLKCICRALGVNKVLLKLPDIFCADKQFFSKVLKAYSQKIKPADYLNAVSFDEIKNVICENCSSSELAELLSKKLKEEEQENNRTPIKDSTSLNAMLKRMPMDVIISHTVANEELIPSNIVLDIALQNNTPEDIGNAMETQSATITKGIFDKIWKSQYVVSHLKNNEMSKESLLNIFKAVSSKLNSEELLDAFHEAMKQKFTE